MVWLDRLVTNLELKLWFGITAVDIFIYLMRCYEVHERERTCVLPFNSTVMKLSLHFTSDSKLFRACSTT